MSPVGSHNGLVLLVLHDLALLLSCLLPACPRNPLFTACLKRAPFIIKDV